MPPEFWMKQTVENTLFAVLYWANIFVFYPKLANRFYGISYLIALIGAVWLIVIANLWFADLIHVDAAFAKRFSTPGHPYIPNHHWTKTWITGLSVILLGIGYVSVVAKKLQKNQLAFEISEKERVSAELALLKAQINPHFFFNTLHTIYSLMDTNPGSAKESLYSLSHMMRYVLYETKNEKTSLLKEIDFIEDYIALMKIRIAEDVQIIFDKPTDIRDLLLAPMLFLPFVENAFKHGISAVNPSYVYIEILINENQLIFEIRNSLFSGLAQQLDDDNGIGIVNTRRRLELIYPGKYTLLVEKDDFAKEFVVTLKLNINEH